MALTNNHDLPKEVLAVVGSFKYRKGAADFSATDLLSAPQPVFIKRWTKGVRDLDASDLLFSTLGNAVHKAYEDRYANDEGYLSEVRMFTTVNGVRISGQMDLFRKSDNTLIDIKTIKAYKAFSDSTMQAWTSQVNIYAYLLRHATSWVVYRGDEEVSLDLKGLLAERAEIHVWVRDFSKASARFQKDYPPHGAYAQHVELWTPDEQKRYIEERVQGLIDANDAVKSGKGLPPCTDEDRWMTSGMKAISDGGATRKIESVEEFNEKYRGKGTWRLEEMPRKPIKCLDYCEGAPWCRQFQEENGQKALGYKERNPEGGADK